jgi:DNA-directed RNA polymerase specialized sigma24 family protein
VRERLRALTTDQYRRLAVRSQVLVRDQRLLAADLRQEAICRALDGRRKCRQSWDIVAFLNWVMRSMIRDAYRDEAEGRTLVLRDDLDTARLDDDLPSLEQMTHDAIDYGRTIASIWGRFAPIRNCSPSWMPSPTGSAARNCSVNSVSMSMGSRPSVGD